MRGISNPIKAAFAVLLDRIPQLGEGRVDPDLRNATDDFGLKARLFRVSFIGAHSILA